MHIATFDTSTGVTQHLVQVEAVVKAESLVQPLLVLTPRAAGRVAAVGRKRERRNCGTAEAAERRNERNLPSRAKRGIFSGSGFDRSRR